MIYAIFLSEPYCIDLFILLPNYIFTDSSDTIYTLQSVQCSTLTMIKSVVIRKIKPHKNCIAACCILFCCNSIVQSEVFRLFGSIISISG